MWQFSVCEARKNRSEVNKFPRKLFGTEFFYIKGGSELCNDVH